MATTRSKHGVHDENLVNMSARVQPELMALAKITCMKKGCKGTELIDIGVRTVATQEGILVNGQISPEYKDVYELQLEIIKAKRQEHLNKQKGLVK